MADPRRRRLSDRVGRKPVLLAGVLGYVVLSYPLFLLLAMVLASALVAQLTFAVLLSLVGGPAPATYVELFPTRIRYTGIAMARAWLRGSGWQCHFPGLDLADGDGIHDCALAFYLLVVAILAGGIIVFIRDRYRDPLR